LLANGADPNQLNADLTSPLWIAASNGDVEMTRLLIEAGADPNIEESVNPLTYAILKQHFDVAKVLILEGGADPDLTGFDTNLFSSMDLDKTLENTHFKEIKNFLTPVPHGQHWFINRIKKLGYQVKTDGFCF